MNSDQEYDNWNVRKKQISKNERVYFDKGEIWYASLGKNIGDEEDGKNDGLERPILITRKFNNNIFICVPLLDAKRLLRFMGKVDSGELRLLKKELGNIV